MTAAGHRWVRLLHRPEWHIVKRTTTRGAVVTICNPFAMTPSAFSDFDPVEDECRLCRRALDGGKTT